jgi:iron complex transport system substrate-binding protein
VKRLTLLLAAVAIAALALAPAAGAAKKDPRVVALTPFSANVLVELGVKPVAIGEALGGEQHLSKKLKNVDRLPLSHASNGPNLEQLAAKDPDIMFSERTWNAGHGAVEDLGIDVVEADPFRVSYVRRAVEEIGAAVGEKKKAKKIGARITKQYIEASKGIKERPDVLMILGVGQTPYAFLPNSWGGDLVSRAGGDLITDGLESDGSNELLVSGGYAQLSDEEITIRDPEVIIAVPHGRDEDMDAIAESLREDETLEDTRAGQNDRIYVTTDNSLLQASTGLAKTIKRVRSEYLLND